MKIILFEDDETQATNVVDALKRVVGKSDLVIRFQSEKDDSDDTYEKRLRDELCGDPYKDATLIVADRDLSKTRKYRGLSESLVRRVADQLAIPQCSYSRNASTDLLAIAEERESYIAVSISEGAQKCAENLVSIAKGFIEIHDKLAHASAGKQSAGKTLASILGKPEYADKIALYASGDRNRPGHVLHMAEDKESASTQVNRLTCLFGYWLWDSVLQYPGVVVNKVAATSYLDIRTDQFSDGIEALFSAARYDGPFADAKEPLWWRGMLDDIVAKEQLRDGREFAIKKLNRATHTANVVRTQRFPLATTACSASAQSV
jgi:hypothetical protein